MVILVCLLTQYMSGEWSDRVSAEEFQNAVDPQYILCWVMFFHPRAEVW